jgi:tetratricopeptide (TPR) repeat protein
MALARVGKYAEAKEAFRLARDRFAELQKNKPTSTFAAGETMALCNLGAIHAELGEVAAAMEAFDTAEVIIRRLLKANPTERRYALELASLRVTRGLLLANSGKLAEARKEFEASRDGYAALFRRHPQSAMVKHALAVAHKNLGIVLSTQTGARRRRRRSSNKR